MEPPDPFARTARAWQAIRAPLSFGLGALIILTEVTAWLVWQRAVEPQLLVIGAGFCGLPAFAPLKK